MASYSELAIEKVTTPIDKRAHFKAFGLPVGNEQSYSGMESATSVSTFLDQYAKGLDGIPINFFRSANKDGMHRLFVKVPFKFQGGPDSAIFCFRSKNEQPVLDILNQVSQPNIKEADVRLILSSLINPTYPMVDTSQVIANRLTIFNVPVNELVADIKQSLPAALLKSKHAGHIVSQPIVRSPRPLPNQVTPKAAPQPELSPKPAQKEISLNLPENIWHFKNECSKVSAILDSVMQTLETMGIEFPFRADQMHAHVLFSNPTPPRYFSDRRDIDQQGGYRTAYFLNSARDQFGKDFVAGLNDFAHLTKFFKDYCGGADVRGAKPLTPLFVELYLRAEMVAPLNEKTINTPAGQAILKKVASDILTYSYRYQDDQSKSLLMSSIKFLP